jgi:hypothetical protein
VRKISLILLSILLLSTFTSNDQAFASNNVELSGGVIINSTTLVPMRDIFESLGATVQWDGSTKTITGIKGDTKITLQIGSISAKINGSIKGLSVSPRIINSKTMIPLRFVSESLGAKVNWEGDQFKAIITSDSKVISVSTRALYNGRTYLNDPTKTYIYQNSEGKLSTYVFLRYEDKGQVWEGHFSEGSSTLYHYFESENRLFHGWYQSEGFTSIKYPIKVGQQWVDGYEGEETYHTIISVNDKITTPAGSFSNVIVVKDSDGYYTYFADGIGHVATKKKTSAGLKTVYVLKELKSN